LNFGSISEYSFADTPSYTPKGKSQPNIQLHDQPIMSDEQHEGIIASVVDMDMQKRDFTYNIIPDGITVPVNYPGQLAAGSKRIYDTWHFFLGEKNLRQSRIEVPLIGGTDRFNAIHVRYYLTANQLTAFTAWVRIKLW
jgi:hypothetical protein